MTCPLPSKGAAPVVMPAVASYYSRNFHLPIFKHVTIVNTVSVVFLPSPIKIVAHT